ncbi:MAG TPA: sugar phosphate isomerase/epimerase [Vicinamibacteria bacterium]|nr:sugar phosphate isomerase/epimerase [Vicinamibacteria bacterium]
MAAAPRDRRSFLLAATGAGVAAASAASAAQTPGSGPSIRLGAPVWAKDDDPDALARAHRAKGYRAAYCPKIPLTDRERLRATEEAFARNGVVIAEVGRWVNLLDPDAEARTRNLATVTEGLALAEAVGARCCVDIAGSFSPTSWFGPHPDNLGPRFFDAAVENARKILDAVKPTRTTFCYELMAWSLPDSPDACLRLIAAVDRKAFSVHLDPCNLVNSPERYYRSSEVIRECYRKLGPRIASVHAKDLAWDVEMAVHFREVRIGLGSIDSAVCLAEHARYAPAAPLRLEHLKEEADYDAARDQVLATGARVGIRFD